jgi:excisionase family DNA binding protein
MKRDLEPTLAAQRNVSIAEAAEFLAVNRMTVTREIDALRLPFTRVRGRRTIPLQALIAYRDAQTKGAQ